MPKQRLSKIAAALKANVKGRDTDAFVGVGTLSIETGIRVTWIRNAINGRLLEYQFGVRGAHWAGSNDGSIILVPMKLRT
jgi:hypothetical protein